MEALIALISSLNNSHLQLVTIYSFIAIALVGFTFSERFESVDKWSKTYISITFIVLSVIAAKSTLSVTEPYNVAVKELKALCDLKTQTPNSKSDLAVTELYQSEWKSILNVAHSLKEKPMYWIFTYYSIWIFFAGLFVWSKNIRSLIIGPRSRASSYLRRSGFNKNMKLKIVTDCSGVDWETVAESLKKVRMAYHKPEVHKRSFEASHTKVFIYDDSQLIGFGRAISDGEYQGAIYDVAVLPEAQGKGVGKIIMQTILDRLPNCNFILYATPGMEDFYKKLGFRLMKTGMAVFTTQQAMEKFTE